MLKKLLGVLAFAVLTACGESTQASTQIVLDATEFAYSPISATVPVGEPVLLTLKNSGLVEHDFVIEKVNASVQVVQDSGSDAHHAHGMEADYDLHVSAQPGDVSVIQVTISEPGTYTFFCSVAGHKEVGMLGELLVVAQE